MLHEPAVAQEKDFGTEYKMKLGVKMFWLYAVIYSGFVAINLLDAKLMETTVFMGLNLAVVYGFGLIVLALILALFYNHACTERERVLAAEESRGGSS